MSVQVTLSPVDEAGPVAERILRALPAWFGIEEATLEYIRDAHANPTFVADDGGEAVGFLTLVVHTAYAAEIHVMGVLPSYHRHGVGRQMVAVAEAYLRRQGIAYLQVKTLNDTHLDEGYARTRQFYLAMGFRPLEVFPDLWGPHNPCLQLIKAL